MTRNLAGLSRVARALFVWAGAAILAQAQAGSLADAARQARSQKQSQPQAQGEAQQFADELAEDQSDNGAPGGFKTYNTGDYKIWVPAPYHVDGRDASGVVLSGPMVGFRHPVVLLGTPFLAHFGNSDSAFQETALKFAHLYADETSCTKTSIAKHAAYSCGMGVANILGQRVTGSAAFVESMGKVYPIFCATPSDSSTRDYVNTTTNSYNKINAQRALAHEHDEIKAVLQKCDTVFESIQIPEGISAQKAAAAISKAETESAPAKPVASSVASAAPNTIASEHPATAPPEPATASSALPPGSKVHAFTYCQTQRECFDASVLVPSAAQLVSSDCKQYVFETKVDGEPFLLLAGTGAGEGCGKRSINDANQIRWKQLVDPESERAPGTSSTISSLQSKVDGKTAVITTMRFKRNLADWMVKRAEVESNGVSIVVGCMGPRDHFADGDGICSALIDSLRLP